MCIWGELFILISYIKDRMSSSTSKQKHIHSFCPDFSFFFVLLCVLVCWRWGACEGNAWAGQKGAPVLLELELQEVVRHLTWTLRTEQNSHLTPQPSLQAPLLGTFVTPWLTSWLSQFQRLTSDKRILQCDYKIIDPPLSRGPDIPGWRLRQK